ncbi:MAG: preprotein translocase subunit SecG [Meiothermus sp.]
MAILSTLVIIFFVLAAGLLVYLVLSQEPKQGAGDLMGGNTDLFSARGVTGGLYRITVILGVIFVVLAFALGHIPRG